MQRHWFHCESPVDLFDCTDWNVDWLEFDDFVEDITGAEENQSEDDDTHDHQVLILKGSEHWFAWKGNHMKRIMV